MNCSSDSVPIGKTVEFLADGETVTNIIKFDGVCFNTIYNRVCTRDICSCSVDDRFYTLFYNPPYHKTKLTFVCKVKLDRNRKQYSNKAIVNILDLPTPSIHIVGTLPFISGTTAKLESVAKKTNEIFVLTWKCGYITYDKTFMSNNTSVWSNLLLKVDSSFNNIQCQCIIQIPGVNFTLIDAITLRIKTCRSCLYSKRGTWNVWFFVMDSQC